MDIGFRNDGGGVVDVGGGTLAGDDGTETEATKGVPSGGGWLNNGLEQPNVAGIDPAFGLSTAAGLSPDGLVAASDFRSTVEYVVECALGVEDSVTKVTAVGEVITFRGALGLAPQWRDGSCDEDCQEWVSACVLARTNHTGENVRIWMQADHPEIGFGVPGEAVLEAGFFGNLFAGTDEKFYCKGEPTGNVAAKREGRTCSSGSNTCEFIKLNNCSQRCDLVGAHEDVPANCWYDSSVDRYHTIATYITEN